jgi:hypothetical protein
MPASDLTEEVLEALSEAAVEIANLSSPDNVVCRRLRELQKKLASRSVTVGELARQIDISPRDVLDAAIAVGIRPFWYEGQQFRDASYLHTFLRMRFHSDPVPYFEFNLTPALTDRLATELGVTPEELLSPDEMAQTKPGLGPRKFVTSESRFPESTSADRRREQFG